MHCSTWKEHIGSSYAGYFMGDDTAGGIVHPHADGICPTLGNSILHMHLLRTE